MKPFAVIDCETPPFRYGRDDLLPFVWGYYDGENYEQFDNTEDLVRYISDLEIIVYAHNGGRFDFHFLADFFEPNRPIMLINGRIAKLKLGKCELRDSYNIIPVPLSDYEKEKIDYSLFEKETRETPHIKKMIEDYLYSDCVNLYNIVRAFREKHGNALTQAGASMKYFKALYDIEEIKTSLTYFEHFKPFYYGGRVQCFQRGVIEKPFQVFDINSAYPHAMLKVHPFGTRIIQKIKPIEYAHENPQAFFDIYAVSKGALPWRDQVGGKLLFPSDDERRRYQVTGWEIAAALDFGALTDIEVRAVYVSDETVNFSDYILPLYEARLAAAAVGDEAEKLLLKLLMNSLYGKFGSDPRHYTKDILLDRSHYTALSTTGVRYAGNQVTDCEDAPLYEMSGELGDCLVGSRPLREHEMHFYNVATAASITGCVRAFLYRSMMTVGMDNVLYCDTDSIATLRGDGLETGKALGQWKHEGDFKRAAIAGRKMYAFYPADGSEPKTASKGVRLTANQIEAVALGNVEQFAKDAPSFSVRFGQRYISRKVVATS